MLFQVPVSGERPMKIQATGLPPGLKMDSRGLIAGTAPSGKREYKVNIQASNRHGKDMKELILKVGDELCLTPPMGWSSWYSYSEAVGQDNVLKTARLFVERGLVNHGWAYINIDDCWQGRRGGKYGAIQPNKRFPDMKAMCDAIHAMGMKVGIYSTPWMGTYAGLSEGARPTLSRTTGKWPFRKRSASRRIKSLEVIREFIAERRIMWEPSGCLTVTLNNGRIGGSIM